METKNENQWMMYTAILDSCLTQPGGHLKALPKKGGKHNLSCSAATALLCCSSTVSNAMSNLSEVQKKAQM